MKVLVVKLTSMGDVIHALPALTDAHRALPTVRFDFLVEESFQEIPTWHPAVANVIAVATRRWRKSLLSSRQEIVKAVSAIRATQYDAIIDLQGLMKSAFLCRLAKGVCYGYDQHSVREPLASRFYHQRFAVDKNLHAIDRVRILLAAALNYAAPSVSSIHDEQLDYAIQFDGNIGLPVEPKDYVVFLHGTTWRSKEWPESSWRALLESFSDQGLTVYLPWGNPAERQRAERLQGGLSFVQVLPKMSLSQLGILLQNAQGVVAVDTGLGHLSAALGRPTISIYGPTDTALIGTIGQNQQHLSVAANVITSKVKKSECFDYSSISAANVKHALCNLMKVET